MTIEVTEVQFGFPTKTRLWCSPKVVSELAAFKKVKRNDYHQFLMKLERYAKNGFDLYARVHPPSIVFEGDGVFRIGTVDTLFRIIGFYNGGNALEFIAIDSFLKHGTKLSASDRRCIAWVQKVRKEGLWKKKVENGTPPLRLVN